MYDDGMMNGLDSCGFMQTSTNTTHFLHSIKSPGMLACRGFLTYFMLFY